MVSRNTNFSVKSLNVELNVNAARQTNRRRKEMSKGHISCAYGCIYCINSKEGQIPDAYIHDEAAKTEVKPIKQINLECLS